MNHGQPFAIVPNRERLQVSQIVLEFNFDHPSGPIIWSVQDHSVDRCNQASNHMTMNILRVDAPAVQLPVQEVVLEKIEGEIKGRPRGAWIDRGGKAQTQAAFGAVGGGGIPG